jgi:DNA-binding MarR family transcriptional regulator
MQQDARAEVDALERTATALIRRLGDRAGSAEIAARAGCSLPAASVLLLEHLEEAGPRRVSQIAECQKVGMPAVTPRLKDLEAAGLIARGADPADARVSLISLTAAGRAIVERIRAARCEVLADALHDLDPATIAVATGALGALERALSRSR